MGVKPMYPGYDAIHAQADFSDVNESLSRAEKSKRALRKKVRQAKENGDGQKVTIEGLMYMR